MDNQLKPLAKVFSQNLLRIPDYQRGYAWTSKQLKDFWSDIIQLEESRNHYVGVLTFESVPKEDYKQWTNDSWIIDAKCFEPYYIVDGQQRLTTTLILIQCILQSLPENCVLNFTTSEDIRKRYIYDSKPNSIDNSGSYIFGYHEDNPSYEYLKTKIFERSSQSAYLREETIYTRNLQKAKDFFLEKLAGLKLEDIEAIYKKITQHFLFNIYSISSEIDVHVAFEGMNNRGKPLSVLELLKNRLIYLSTKFDIEEFERQALRRSINECWKSVYHFLGRNKEKPLDDDRFLFNHFFLFYYDEITEKTDIDSIGGYTFKINSRSFRANYHDYLLDKKFTLKNISNPNFIPVESSEPDFPTISEKDLYEYSQNLQQAVESWYYIYNPFDSKDFNQEEKLWLDKLNMIGFIDISILMLAIYSKSYSEKSRINCLKAIERYLFVRTLSHSRNYYSYSLDINFMASDLIKGRKSLDATTKIITEECNEIYDNEEFIKSLKSDFRNSGFYKWPGIKYFLFEYEQSLKKMTRNSTAKINWDEFKKDMDDYVTVEHIYPQSEKRKCWHQFDQYTTIQRKALKNSLGNLLPLSRPKNSSLQDKCFADKKINDNGTIGFNMGSYSEIQVSRLDEWNAQAILDRGMNLLNFLEARWDIDLGDTSQKQKFLGLDFMEIK